MITTADLRSRLTGLLVLGLIALSSAFLFVVAAGIWLLTSWWDRRKVVLHRFTCLWASIYTWLIPAWPLTLDGKEHIRKGATYVMVSNHQSLLDVLMYFRLFVHFKWVSKAEMFRVPFIGWNMALNGYIPIRRGDPDSATEMFERCRRALERGSSIFMFPEGTRSPDGRLGPFRTGAFRIALDARVPILPMVIDGTADALPKKTLDIRGRHAVRIQVLPEIPYDDFRDLTPEQLAERVRARIAAALVAGTATRVRPGG